MRPHAQAQAWVAAAAAKLAMSSRTKKKTVAQVRAENKQREDDLDLGNQLADEVGEFLDLTRKRGPKGAREEVLNAFLDKANRACELLQHYDPGFDSYFYVMRIKASIYVTLWP